jgi:hypothetical protein
LSRPGRPNAFAPLGGSAIVIGRVDLEATKPGILDFGFDPGGTCIAVDTVRTVGAAGSIGAVVAWTARSAERTVAADTTERRSANSALAACAAGISVSSQRVRHRGKSTAGAIAATIGYCAARLIEDAESE